MPAEPPQKFVIILNIYIYIYERVIHEGEFRCVLPVLTSGIQGTAWWVYSGGLTAPGNSLRGNAPEGTPIKDYFTATQVLVPSVCETMST